MSRIAIWSDNELCTIEKGGFPLAIYSNEGFNSQQSKVKRGKLTFEGPHRVETTVVAPFVVGLAAFTSAHGLRNAVMTGPIVVPTAA